MKSHVWQTSFLWSCRLRAASKAQAENPKKPRARDRGVRAVPAPEANAELQVNIDVCLIMLLLWIITSFTFGISIYKIPSKTKNDEIIFFWYRDGVWLHMRTQRARAKSSLRHTRTEQLAILWDLPITLIPPLFLLMPLMVQPHSLTRKDPGQVHW